MVCETVVHHLKPSVSHPPSGARMPGGWLHSSWLGTHAHGHIVHRTLTLWCCSGSRSPFHLVYASPIPTWCPAGRTLCSSESPSLFPSCSYLCQMARIHGPSMGMTRRTLQLWKASEWPKKSPVKWSTTPSTPCSRWLHEGLFKPEPKNRHATKHSHQTRGCHTDP